MIFSNHLGITNDHILMTYIQYIYIYILQLLMIIWKSLLIANNLFTTGWYTRQGSKQIWISQECSHN